MKNCFLFLAMMLVLFLAGCRAAVDPEQPPEIRYGEDTCDLCNMIISEPRFAAAYASEAGEVRRFDDLGDMLVYHSQNGEAVAAFWVHDYQTAGWLQAEEAHYVLSEELITPMGHGIVAVADRAAAEALVEERGGTIMDFASLMTEAVPEMHNHSMGPGMQAMDHDHGMGESPITTDRGDGEDR